MKLSDNGHELVATLTADTATKAGCAGTCAETDMATPRMTATDALPPRTLIIEDFMEFLRIAQED
jgi:hypothetical protein